MPEQQLKKELKEILLRDFDKDLSDIEVTAIGQDLVNLFELLSDINNETDN